MHISALIALGLIVMMGGMVHTGKAQGRDSLSNVEDFRPGDTLRYTTDGSSPDRTSRYVLAGANDILVVRTTIINARLYRPGFLPSEVQSRTVYVRGSGPPARAALKW